MFKLLNILRCKIRSSVNWLSVEWSSHYYTISTERFQILIDTTNLEKEITLHSVAPSIPAFTHYPKTPRSYPSKYPPPIHSQDKHIFVPIVSPLAKE